MENQNYTSVKLFILIVFGILFGLFFLLTSACTYNVSMVHTEGTATDVIDNDQTADPNIAPTVNIPATI